MKLSNKAAQKELARRKLEKDSAPKFNIQDFLFKEQLDFVKDPARFATAVCSVRAGKTVACAADLVDTALTQPGTIGLYITLARSSAKKIVWPDLRKIVNDFKLNGLCSFNQTELSITFTNGSRIFCSGANTEEEIEKVRGLSNVALVYIDESQAFRSHIKELVEDIIIKRLYDTNGRCRLIGTPGPIPSGYFYDAAHSSKWSHHAWTLHKNIWIEKKSKLSVEQLIQQDCDLRGVTIDHPSIQRESFGRWVLDKNSLLLEYTSEHNHYESLPTGNYHYILGIDLGFNDSDALSVLAWSESSPITYLVEEIVTANQLIDSLMNQISDLNRRYPFSKIVADTGGLGKKIIESLKVRYPIPIEAADKTGKMAAYAILKNAMNRGHFKAKNTSRFSQDCSLLEKDIRKSTPDKIIVKGHSDAIDSALYAFHFSPAFTYQAPIPTTRIGTFEWGNEEQERMHRLEYERVKQEQSVARDPFGYGLGIDPLANLDKWKKG